MFSKQYQRTPGMYQIKILLSGMVYAGSTGNVYSRLLQHRAALKLGMHSNVKLQSTFNTWAGVEVLVIYTETVEEARSLEQQFLDQNLGKDNICNVGSGATNTWIKGKMSEEMRQTIIKTNTGLKRSPETIAKLRESALRYSASPNYKPPVRDITKYSIDGIVYVGVREVMKALGISRSGLYKRLSGKVKGYENWKTLK